MMASLASLSAAPPFEPGDVVWSDTNVDPSWQAGCPDKLAIGGRPSVKGICHDPSPA